MAKRKTSAEKLVDAVFGTTDELTCPRCGGEMHRVEVRNALSRRRKGTYICSPCGTDEALRDMMGMEPVKIWLMDLRESQGSQPMYIVKKPGLKPEIAEGVVTFEEMKRVVDGFVEVVRITEDIIMLIDEDGQLKGKMPNFKYVDRHGKSVPIAGIVAFVADCGEDWGALDKVQIRMTMEMFAI